MGGQAWSLGGHPVGQVRPPPGEGGRAGLLLAVLGRGRRTPRAAPFPGFRVQMWPRPGAAHACPPLPPVSLGWGAGEFPRCGSQPAAWPLSSTFWASVFPAWKKSNPNHNYHFFGTS